MNKDVIVWTCSIQKISNKFIEHFNNVSGGKKPLWRIMCKYNDKANMEHQGILHHFKDAIMWLVLVFSGPRL